MTEIDMLDQAKRSYILQADACHAIVRAYETAHIGQEEIPALLQEAHTYRQRALDITKFLRACSDNQLEKKS